MRRSFRNGRMKLRYVSQSGHWPSGNPRLYVRRAGKRTPMPDADPASAAFLAAYAKAVGLDAAPAPPAATGTIAAACLAFLRSDSYANAAPATRALWRRAMDDIRARYGAGKLADLGPKHIRADLARLKPNPAATRFKAWRAAAKWWIVTGMVQTDPTAGITKPKAPASEGHTPWTREDVATFRKRWPINSAERLAFELIFWTGARMSDAVRITEGMIGKDGWLTFRQQKTGGEVAIPVRAAAPAWAEPDGQLVAALEARPERHVSLMVTAQGRPRSIKAASQWFAAAARAAKIEGKTAHGLRKLRAQIMAENGATTHQIAAWTGHETLAEVERYSRAAERRRIISGTETANSPGKVPTFGSK